MDKPKKQKILVSTPWGDDEERDELFTPLFIKK